MSWQPPEDTGGSFIKNYVIEKLDPDTGKWTRAATSRVPRCTVDNLLSNKPYQFRITAENTQGASEPSEPTNTVQTQGKFKLHFKRRTIIHFQMLILDSNASNRRRPGKDDDSSRRRRNDLPPLDNYDRCCTYFPF